MLDDENEIRNLISTWMAATKAGDSQTVLGLMADDVMFLVPGKPPFGKSEFAEMARAQSDASVEFDGRSRVREIKVLGDWAFVVNDLTVTIKAGINPEMTRSGHTLSIFTRRDGKWLLARDANLLGPAAQ